MRAAILFIAIFFGFQFGLANTIVVTNTNNAGTGSFRDAVLNAVDGDTIRFNPLIIANGSDTIKLVSTITIGKKLVVKGLLNATDTLYISGQNLARVLGAGFSTSATGIKNIVLDSLVLIDGNAGTGQGGGLFVGALVDTLFLSNSIIRNCAAKFGGGIYGPVPISSTTKAPLIFITKSKLEDNHSTDFGGAFCSYFAELKTQDVTVVRNSSERGGGFYFHAEGTSQLINTKVINNTASQSGAGFNAHFTDTVSVSNCIFEGNIATLYGGGIFSSGKLDVRKTIVRHNTGTTRGGGIHFGPFASVMTVDSCTISNNTSGSGAGIYSESQIDITYTTFDKNTGGVGGGLNYTSAIANVLGCTFSNNSGSSGGGIYAGQNGTLNINKSTFANNSAISGGGIYCFTPYGNSSFSLLNSTVTNNSGVFGGGIHLRTSSTLSLNADIGSSIIANNGTENIRAINDTINSLGYNVFGDSIVIGSQSTDQLNVSDSLLSLRPLGNYGGATQTAPPNKGSVAINSGNPLDPTVAQNMPVNGTRDAGAAELVGVYHDTIKACTLLNWYGSLYTVSGNYVHTLPNSAGTDTVATLNLSITPPANGVDVITACSPYQWTNGLTYTSNNSTATDTLLSFTGCDSIVTLDLTIIPNANSTDVITACNSYMWIDGITYTANNNTAIDTLVSSTGCDSIVTLNLTILSSNTGIDVISACEDYRWIDGITYTSSNNTATHTLLNSAGCDSVVSLDLTINRTNTNVLVNGTLLTADALNAKYQWVNCNNNFAVLPADTLRAFQPIANGNYAVIVTENGCSDTSACQSISGISLSETAKVDVNIFPNPNYGSFKVEFEDHSFMGILQIESMNGQVLHKQKVENLKTLELNLTLTKGAYLLRLYSEKENSTQQLFIQ